jgi:hypothetical protein
VLVSADGWIVAFPNCPSRQDQWLKNAFGSAYYVVLRAQMEFRRSVAIRDRHQIIEDSHREKTAWSQRLRRARDDK